MKIDGIQLDLFSELRYVQHFLFRLTDVTVNEVPVKKEAVLRQDCKGVPDLLLSNAFLKLPQDPVVRGFDPEKEDPKHTELVEELTPLQHRQRCCGDLR